MSYKPEINLNDPIIKNEIPDGVVITNRSTNHGRIAHCDFTYIRNNPDFGAHIVGNLKEGTRVEIINDTDAKFYKVKASRMEGYCAKKFVSRR